MDKHEALAVIRKNYPHVASSGSQFETALRELIPDLKESEDESIRKEMIAFFQDIKEVATKSENLDKWIVYLEKQKELDNMIVVSPEVWDNAISDAFENGKKEGEKQKEQKFTEKQDYSDLTDLERAIHRGFLVVGVENVPVTIIKETAQDCLAQMKQQKGANGNEKEIPNEKKPAEWSEKDDQMRGTCIYLLEHGEVIGPWKDCIAWLKSLRPPQYCENCKLKRSVENWKPSEEQMNALMVTLEYMPDTFKPRCTLITLQNDLKKLM